jgi:type IV secretory pathway VirB3-like protein
VKKSVVHQSLNRDKTSMGVNIKILALETGLVCIVSILHLYYFILLVLLIHMIFKFMMKHDVKIMEAFKIFAFEPDYWDPWPNIKTFNKRNDKYGKGLPK